MISAGVVLQTSINTPEHATLRQIIPTMIIPDRSSTQTMSPSVGLLIVVLFCTAQGFVPNENGRYKKSTSHEEITEFAVVSMAQIFMDDYPDNFPDQEEVLASGDFISALENFKDGSTIPDTEDAIIELNEAHFDAEKITESNQRVLDQRIQVLNAMNGDDMPTAQGMTGQLLHTLQDFYSHSNWVEMGNTDINHALGDPAEQANIGPVATLDDPTCSDCDTNECEDNILSEINAAGILTSGYVFMDPPGSDPDPRDHKPEGKDKCSHGGKDDITADLSATGGINKDTLDDKFSPHHYLHNQAASLAQTASLEFLKGIRESRNDKEFAKYLGLNFGASLCYIIDTTGSMANEIDAVITVTINLTRRNAAGSNPPSDYILVPFNDPDFGPVYATTDSEQMVSWLGNLTAAGGGDGPELFFSGTIMALNAVRPGSLCYAYTDAPAKDAHLEPEARALATSDGIDVEVHIFMTGLGLRSASNTGEIQTKKQQSRAKQHNQATRRRHRRRRQTPGTDYYDGFALATGGKVIQTSDSEIHEAVKVVEHGLSTTKVTLLQIDHVTATSAEYDVAIDETLVDVVITVTDDVSDFKIFNSDGVEQTPGAPGSGAVVILEVDASTVKLYTIARPSPGTWKVQVASPGEYSISVTASSFLSFQHQFVVNVTNGHGGYRTIPGKPVAGEAEILVIKMHKTAASSVLSQVTDLILTAVDGSELQRHTLHELETLKEYEATTVLPTAGFRVSIEGIDGAGNTFRRVDPAVVATSSISMSVVMDTSGGFSVEPGDVINIDVMLNNSGTTDTYTLNISDSQKFFVSIVPQQITVSPGTPATAVATFRAPEDASLGVVSTVTVTGTGTSTTDANYVVFRLATSSPTIDTTAPTCTVTSSGNTGDCSGTQSGSTPCTHDFWYIDFTAQDSGLGLYSIKPAETHSTANLTVPTYTAGTTEPVMGRYSSNCCNPSVTIVASDALGNAGRCHVTYDAEPDDNGATINGINIACLFAILFTTLIHW